MLTRGSKSAAEKVVRESESPDMGSPDKREYIAPVTDAEDSPLFKYLCNLSPIKPARAVHHAQTYNELTFPPEPRIFASPRSSRRSSNNSLKRVVAAELLLAQAQAEGRESLGWPPTNSRSTMSGNVPSPSPLNHDQQITPCSRRQTEELPGSQSNSAKNENDAFTVEELVGQGIFAMNPMNRESSERTAVTAASFQSEFTDFGQLDPATIVECLNGKVEEAGGTSTVAVERRNSTSSSLSQDCVLPGNLTEESKCLEQNDPRPNEEHGLNFSKETSELDRDTTDMAYFLAGNEVLGQEKGEWSQDSSDLVALNEEAGKQETDLLEAMASQSGLDLSGQNKDDDGATENANHQHSLLSLRADSAGQRGFRRRCLDFDASGARRKSLGSMVTRKSLGSRLKDCSGTSVAEDNDAPPVHGNVTPTTSDATPSTPVDDSSPNAIDALRAESDSGKHTRGESLGAMTKTHQQPLPSQPHENNLDVLNAKTAEALPQKPQNSGINPPAEGVRRSPRVRRTGIGLHLNSLTSSMSFKRDYPSSGGESAKRVLATSLGLQPVTSATPKVDSQGSYGAGPHTNQSLNQGLPSLSKERKSQAEINSRDAAAVDIPTPDFRSLNIENLPPLEESLALAPIPTLPRLVSPRGQKRSLPHPQELGQQGEEETGDDLPDSPQSSKRRRLARRKPTASSQGDKPADGCKRCNCKKSKCLKLYCECFAAGTYCVGSCACRHCFNKAEYEDTVRNTRLQIESRNPLAFAPKIVQGAEASPVPGDEALDTPASARHKRGCNCKKSLCLKKYCECFQAGVGCSEGCRCEGCKNVYGRKEGPVEGDEKEGVQAISSREESQVDEPIELLSKMKGNPDRLQDCAKLNLSSITPSFEHDGYGRSMLRLRSTGRKRISSDEQCAPPLAPHVSKPPKSPTSFSNTLNSFDLVPHPPQGDSDFSMNGSGESPMTTPTFARMGHASSRWEGLTDLCTLTPLPLSTTLQPTPGSSCVTSERPGASPAFSSQRTESPQHAASSSSAHHQASSRTWSPHSPRFRQPVPRSPLRFDTPQQSLLPCPEQQELTPAMPSPQIPAEKSLECEPELTKVVDDDSTPDVLKCLDDEMTSPSRSIVITKSRSPKQKRVTPPRHGDRESLQRSFLPSSPGLRNSKRFILQALPPVAPSFPNG